LVLFLGIWCILLVIKTSRDTDIPWKMKDVIESVRFQQESPSAIKSGGCPLSSRIRVRFTQELLSALARNCCPFCSGMSVRFAQEYAEIHSAERDSSFIIENSFWYICFFFQELF